MHEFSLGDMTAVIESKFGVALTGESISDLFHSGQLEQICQPGGWWLARFDADGSVQSVEQRSAEEIAQPLTRLALRRNAALVMIQRNTNTTAIVMHASAGGDITRTTFFGTHAGTSA